MLEETPLKYNKLEIKLFDPNTKQEIIYVADLIELSQKDQAISKICASKKIKEAENKADKAKLSIKY
jgi:hypothetical protein